MKIKISGPLSIPIAARTVQSAAAEMVRYCRRRGEYQDLLSAIWRDAAREGRRKYLDDFFEVILATDLTIGVCHTPELSELIEKLRNSEYAHIFLSDFGSAQGGVNIADMEAASDECTHFIFALGVDTYFGGSTTRARENAIQLERQFNCVYFRGIPSFVLVPTVKTNGTRTRAKRAVQPLVQSILTSHERERSAAGVIRYDGTDFDAMFLFMKTCSSIRRERDVFIKELAHLRSPEGSESGEKKVFITYSHNDAEWVKRIRTHLRAIKHLGVDEIRIWDDTNINPSDRWYKAIIESIDAARVAVLLVSADFFASDFIMEHEWPRIRAARNNGGLEIVPVIIGPCAFAEMPDFRDIQAVNDPRRPVAGLGFAEAERVFDKLRQLVEERLRS